MTGIAGAGSSGRGEPNGAGVLSGRTALVTGGGTGIGRAVALAMAHAGARVAVTYHTHRPDSELVAAFAAAGSPLVALELDATDAAATDTVVASVARELGTIDVLVNNAGGLIAREEVATMTNEHFQEVLEVNLHSAFYATRAVLRSMDRGWGRIVNVSSLAAQNGGGRGASVYAAAKAGMIGFTRALARELAPRHITVNAIAPGLILATPFHETFTPPEDQQAMVAQIPAGRAGLPADVASAAVWLASDGAGFVTGAVLDLNGGQHFR